MNFDGFVVSDWNGHGQIKGCTNDSCAEAINAGIDIVMAPNDWKALYNNTLAQAKSGAIAQSRIDDAVSRILRVKLRAGLFEKPSPANRPLAGMHFFAMPTVKRCHHRLCSGFKSAYVALSVKCN